MTYQESVEWLFGHLPMYQRQGKVAFKKDLGNIRALLRYLGHPENQFRAVHIAGSNGKGSVSHMLSAVLQKSGYKTGLYTSPHVRDFRERIKINGQWVPENYVIDFVREMQKILNKINPSFFEMTVAMAFQYFAEMKPDLAIIETGLGGRLDSTNVLTPLLSVITNVSLEHQDMLGPDIASIAIEKAGIIKSNIPVVVGRHHPDSDQVISQHAKDANASLYFAPDQWTLTDINSSLIKTDLTAIHRSNQNELKLTLASGAHYQLENLKTVLTSLDVLSASWPLINAESIRSGLSDFPAISSFEGRWQVLSDKGPIILADAAHNADGLKRLFDQLKKESFSRLFCIMGTVQGKNLDEIMNVLPQDAHYYVVRPNVPRGLDAHILFEKSKKKRLKAEIAPNVIGALSKARSFAQPDDLILIAGSIFILGDAIDSFRA